MVYTRTATRYKILMFTFVFVYIYVYCILYSIYYVLYNIYSMNIGININIWILGSNTGVDHEGFSGIFLLITCMRESLSVARGVCGLCGVISFFSGSTVPVALHIHHTMKFSIFFFKIVQDMLERGPTWAFSRPDLLLAPPKIQNFLPSRLPHLHPRHMSRAPQGGKKVGIAFYPKAWCVHSSLPC